MPRQIKQVCNQFDQQPTWHLLSPLTGQNFGSSLNVLLELAKSAATQTELMRAGKHNFQDKRSQIQID